jgi:hypothetical protein
MEKDLKIRIPRPLGITQLMSEYHNTHDNSLLDKIQSFIIQQWIISSGSICGIDYDIMELSNFLKCNPDRIRLHMKEQMLSTKLWDREQQSEMLESIMGQQLSWILEDRMEVEGQLKLLKKSQNGTYKPFISSEVSKVIGLKLNTSQTLQSVIKSLNGGGSINIFNQFNQQNNNESVGITLQEALDIVQDENRKVLEQKKEVKYIEESYPIEQLPEVIATKQSNIDTSKEGLSLNRTELNSIVDNYKETTNMFDKEHHEMRREIELQIDKDSEDPELEILYPL